jgi:hypothetical protein
MRVIIMGSRLIEKDPILKSLSGDPKSLIKRNPEPLRSSRPER